MRDEEDIKQEIKKELSKYKTLRPNEKVWSCKAAWKLYLENWRLCHVVVDFRDGHKCIIKGCHATEYLDLDHAITRGRKSTFFETEILGYLCKKHHQIKSAVDGGPTSKLVDLYHIERLGKPRWEELVLLSNQPNPKWRYLYFQELMNEKLRDEVLFYKSRSEKTGCS